MYLNQPSLQGILLQRYKRFLADVQLPDGSIMTVHTPNTGTMLGCAEPGSRVWLYPSSNSRRKYPYSWEIVEVSEGNLVGVNPMHANVITREVFEANLISGFSYDDIQAEQKYLSHDTRFDFFLSQSPDKKDCFVEVKSVTAKRGERTAIFPDAVTKRGLKHLLCLADAVSQGYRALMCFCVQRNDVEVFSPAVEIDPEYSVGLKIARDKGVELLAFKVHITPEEINFNSQIPVIL